MNTSSLLLKLSKLFPKKIAKKYHDFVGLQCGVLKKETNTILLCLDYDFDVYNYILENNLESKIDLILTHHPFIYGKKSKVLKYDSIKRDLFNKTLELDIPVYSFHTNFDEGRNGMNDALAKRLELNDVNPLINDPMARGGKLKEPMDIEIFSKYVIEKLNVSYGELINKGKDTIETVAVVGGGGWSSFGIAMNEGYDIFISGDIPHHGRRGVIANNYNYLNVPHEIEKIFVEQMEKVLLDFNSELKIYKVDHEVEPSIITL